MTKRPTDEKWFSDLGISHPCREWLSLREDLADSIRVIADFGCRSLEFLALLHDLKAAKIFVVNKDADDLKRSQGCFAEVESDLQKFLERRSVRFILEDMSELKDAQLPSNSCDLAYCENVLYIIWKEHDFTFPRSFRKAVDQMARVVRPGGWVIAVEGKIRVDSKQERCDFLSSLSPQEVTLTIPSGDLIDISHCFEGAGLEKVNLKGAPDYAYCYRKPGGPRAANLEKEEER